MSNRETAKRIVDLFGYEPGEEHDVYTQWVTEELDKGSAITTEQNIALAKICGGPEVKRGLWNHTTYTASLREKITNWYTNLKEIK